MQLECGLVKEYPGSSMLGLSPSKKYFQTLPGQEGLVLLNGVQLIGGRIAPFAGQLPSGVLGAIAAGDVNVAAAQVPTTLQA